jgi:hypothetical protein
MDNSDPIIAISKHEIFPPETKSLETETESSAVISALTVRDPAISRLSPTVARVQISTLPSTSRSLPITAEFRPVRSPFIHTLDPTETDPSITVLHATDRSDPRRASDKTSSSSIQSTGPVTENPLPITAQPEIDKTDTNFEIVFPPTDSPDWRQQSDRIEVVVETINDRLRERDPSIWLIGPLTDTLPRVARTPETETSDPNREIPEVDKLLPKLTFPRDVNKLPNKT